MELPKLVRVALLAIASSAILAASSAGQQDATPLPPDGAGSGYTLATPPRVSDAELSRLRDGLAAAENQDWIGLAQLRDSATDPLVRKLLQWRWGSATQAPLYFDDLRTALQDLQGWPGRVTMRTRAEQAIFDSRLSASERIAFLQQDNGPLTGDGRIALAIAQRDQGDSAQGLATARAAWRENTLTDTAYAAAVDAFGSAFTASDYADRVDMLLWRGERSDAQRLLSHLSSSDRALDDGMIVL
jgi:soluble lytic murein transglycosylase